MARAVSVSGPESAQPKHVQVREYVRGLLHGAEPGSPAPSERDLVQRFGVARMTVRQALDVLVSEGLLERVPGRGTFVARTRVDARAQLTGFSEEMHRRGLKPSGRTLLARIEAAGPGVARALEIGEGDPVLHWQRLRFADGTPMCVENAFLPERLVPGLFEPPLPHSLYAELGRRGLFPTSGEDAATADVAGPDEAALLGVAEGASLLRVARRAFARDVVVEVSRSTYRSDRYTLRIPRSRLVTLT